MAKVGKEATLCDLCGNEISWREHEAVETTHKVKGKPLYVTTKYGNDLCESCLAGLLADGRIVPIKYRNAPFFWPGVALGFIAGFMLALTLLKPQGA